MCRVISCLSRLGTLESLDRGVFLAGDAVAGVCLCVVSASVECDGVGICVVVAIRPEAAARFAW